MSTNKDIKIIHGGIAKDFRGQIRFVNDFDMSPIKRFYIIKNVDIDLIRGWRGHKLENRWFYALSGQFEIHIIHIDNWETPSQDLSVESMILNAEDYKLLHIPNGYATAIQAIEPNSELLVYADHPISHASQDDYTWPLEYFRNISYVQKK